MELEVENQSGQAMVEYAIITAVFLAIFIALIDLAQPSLWQRLVDRALETFLVGTKSSGSKALLFEVKER